MVVWYTVAFFKIQWKTIFKCWNWYMWWKGEGLVPPSPLFLYPWHVYYKLKINKQLIIEANTTLCITVLRDKSIWYYIFRKKIQPCICKINIFKRLLVIFKKSSHRIAISIFIKLVTKSTNAWIKTKIDDMPLVSK